MTGIELIPAAVFAVLAVRSAVYWLRHRIHARDMTDDVLFAAFVTGRVGTWLAAAGMFALFGTITVQGRAFTQDAQQYGWLVIVFLALGATQLIAAWFLSARAGDDEDPRGDTGEDADRDTGGDPDGDRPAARTTAEGSSRRP
jgi:hypothetical protein